MTDPSVITAGHESTSRRVPDLYQVSFRPKPFTAGQFNSPMGEICAVNYLYYFLGDRQHGSVG